MLDSLNPGAKNDTDSPIKEKVTETVSGLRSTVDDRVRSTTRLARTQAEAAKQRGLRAAERTAYRIERQVHRDPWRTLGSAAAIAAIGAFAVGVLLGRSLR